MTTKKIEYERNNNNDEKEELEAKSDKKST